MDLSLTDTTKHVPLLSLLKEHFGFTAFRPLQEEIIRDALAGRDVVALCDHFIHGVQVRA